MLNRATIEKRLSLLNLGRRLRGMDQPENSFFMIVMPGGLHIARLAIEHFPPHRKLVVIGNGLDKAEADWARRRLPVPRVLRTRSQLMHHEVLDVLFAAWRPSFGILDYDCFVLDPELIDRLCALDGEASMNAAFFRRNADPALEVPETFLLFFNAPVIRALMARYRVATRPIRWNLLAGEVQDRLRTIGLSESRLPEDHKPYFDTLRLLMMLGLCDGHPYRYAAKIPATPAPSDQAFHVGGISDPLLVQGIWALRGSYFWRKALEAVDDDFLKSYYGAKFGTLGAQELLDRHRPLSDRIDPEFLAFCDGLLDRDRPWRRIDAPADKGLYPQMDADERTAAGAIRARAEPDATDS